MTLKNQACITSVLHWKKIMNIMCEIISEWLKEKNSLIM